MESYLLTPRCGILLEKLTGLQLVKKFPAFYGTRRFITALTSVRQLALSWASPIQSPYPHPTSWRSILILPTHLRLGLPSGLFHSGFPIKILYALLSSPIRATWPAHLIAGYWLPTLFASFPFTSPPVLHRVPSYFNWILPHFLRVELLHVYRLLLALFAKHHCVYFHGSVS